MVRKNQNKNKYSIKNIFSSCQNIKSGNGLHPIVAVLNTLEVYLQGHNLALFSTFIFCSKYILNNDITLQEVTQPL